MRPQRFGLGAALAGAWLCTASAQTPAADWPQWRGPARDGSIPAAQVPAAWPESYAPAWRVDVGEGFSSPVIAAGRVFVHSRRDPQEIVTAIDVASGKVIWQQQYAAGYQKNQYAVKMAKGPNATPLAAGGRVFTLGATGMLVAWDAATGKEIWRQDYSKQIDFSKLFCGTSASPLLAQGRLIVQIGSDVHGGRVLALDPGDGRDGLGMEGRRSRLRVAAARDDRRRRADRHAHELVDRRPRRGEGRATLVRALHRRVAREHRHADLDRHTPRSCPERDKARRRTRSPAPAPRGRPRASGRRPRARCT